MLFGLFFKRELGGLMDAHLLLTENAAHRPHTHEIGPYQGVVRELDSWRKIPIA